MKQNRLAAFGLLLLAASAFAAPPADSTSISPASALGNSACPAWTNKTFQFYQPPTASSTWYVDSRDGQCYEKTSCQNGLSPTGATCNAVVVADPPAFVAAPSGSGGGSGPLGYGTAATIRFSIAPTAVIGSTASINWQAGGDPLPTRVTVGCYSASTGQLRQWWSYPYSSGPSQIPATATLYGQNVCVAFTENNNGRAQSAGQPFTVVCDAMSRFDVASQSCKPLAPPLADCPAFLMPWGGSGPITQLADATPTSLTPDGHAWCYYYGRGGNDGGAPWAAAFDRVVGQPVAYYPYYAEKIVGYNAPVPICQIIPGVGGDSGFDRIFCGGAFGFYPATPIFGFDSTSFQGVIPVYGDASGAVDGGSKCAPVHSTGLSGYYQAWYPSDCSGQGGSGLSLYGPTQYPGDAACIYSLDPANPFRSQRGYTQAKIGLQGDMGGASFQGANGLVYSITPAFAYPATHAGCKPGMVSLGTYDPNAPPTGGGGAP